ncbi:MAG: ATP-binding protein [Defluviitaleaceae bacterium]|nr:ATP-binding protein [Defluviitaleaceae bacterium]
MYFVADILFNYLRDVVYDPDNAFLDIEALPEPFQSLGQGLQYFAESVLDAKMLATSMSKGDLNFNTSLSRNEITAPLKSLQASLRHITWQAQQVAKGDYQQRVDYLGELSEAFNSMVMQLDEKQRIDTYEKSKLQQYVNLILSNIPNILLSFDREGNAVIASESYLRCSKTACLEDIQGKSFVDLFSEISTGDFLKQIEGLFYDVKVNKSTASIEYDLDFGEYARPHTYIIRVTPIFYEGEMLGTMVIFEDITEVIQARKLAVQSSRAKSDFLARMSHEMRTPMNAIVGMSAIGIESDSVEKKNYSFQKIKDASNHLLGVINDILDMSKIEAGKLDLKCEEFVFEDMLNQVKNIIGLPISENGQNFITDIDNDLPLSIISDQQRLTQILINLLFNAVKFTPKHGSITLSINKVSESGGLFAIRFAVKDTGIGIAEEQQSILFDPFEQADGGSARKFGGAGLGLAISKAIVDKMDGKIWVESEFGKGASFIFEIKVREGSEVHTDVGLEPENVFTDGLLAGKRILIAEDVEINREIIATILESTGVEINFAFNGKEAVDKFSSRSNYYDLIFMDVQMPEMDGLEATRRIRALGSLGENIPIIAMTANVFNEDVAKCLESGMIDHVGKPIDFRDLIQKLKYYLKV